MGKKQQRGEATVQQVMDGALRVYAASGEQGLTVSAITQASGVSPGSLYHHFGNLDGIVNALALRSLEQLLDELAEAVERTRGARSGIGAIVRTYLEFAREHPNAARLMHSTHSDHHVMAHATAIRDSQEARLSPIADWIDARIEFGELAPIPESLAESLILGPIVAVTRRWLSVGEVDLQEAARVLPDRIWQSVRP